MKLTLPQFIAMTFAITWVGCEAVRADYENCLFFASLNAFSVAYLNNAHKLAWVSALKMLKRFKISR